MSIVGGRWALLIGDDIFIFQSSMDGMQKVHQPSMEVEPPRCRVYGTYRKFIHGGWRGIGKTKTPTCLRGESFHFNLNESFVAFSVTSVIVSFTWIRDIC